MDAWVKGIILGVGLGVLYALYRYLALPGHGGTSWRDTRMSDVDMTAFIQDFLTQWTLIDHAESLMRFVWDPETRLLSVVSVRTGRTTLTISGEEIVNDINKATLDINLAATQAITDRSPNENSPPTLTDEVTAQWTRDAYGITIRANVAPPPPPRPRQWLPGRDSTGRLAPEFAGELRRADAPTPAPPPVSYPAGRRLNLRPRRDEDAPGGES